jgi:hypothetical protein
VQYRLRREHIPRCLQQLTDHRLAARLERDNNKRRLRCLATIAGLPGVSDADLRALRRGESPVMLLKLRYRLWRDRRKH